jgi:hypothetical protein
MVKLLDSVVSDIMLTQIVTSAVLFAFIGILLAVSEENIFVHWL